MAFGSTLPTRSWLFTPATRPERFSKAAAVSADVLLIDLEDAVAPAEKDEARDTAIGWLTHPVGAPLATALRINGLDTAAGLADVTALLKADADPAFIVLPKTEAAGHMLILDRLLGSASKTARIVPLIESARGLIDVEEVVTASPRIAAVMFGGADMAADLGTVPDWTPMLHARGRIAVAAAAAGLFAIDTPFLSIRDAQGLSEETTRAVAMGFAAKAAIHPDQVSTINDALTPSRDAIAHARAVLDANRSGVGTVDGAMIDEALAKRARRVLAAAGSPETHD